MAHRGMQHDQRRILSPRIRKIVYIISDPNSVAGLEMVEHRMSPNAERRSLRKYSRIVKGEATALSAGAYGIDCSRNQQPWRTEEWSGILASLQGLHVVFSTCPPSQRVTIRAAPYD